MVVMLNVTYNVSVVDDVVPFYFRSPHDIGPFVIITKDAKFYVSWKQTHVLPPPTLQSSCRQINIVLLVDGVHTLANVVITYPIWIDLVSWAILSCVIVATVATQAKDGFYRDQFPMDIFFPLDMEVFECLH
jgi:hypothetical protein